MTTPLTVTTLLDPDLNTLEEYGDVPLAIGQTLVTVIFVTEKISADYDFDSAYVENLVDASREYIGVEPELRLTTGFTVELTAPPNTANYVFRWRVKVRTVI